MADYDRYLIKTAEVLEYQSQSADVITLEASASKLVMMKHVVDKYKSNYSSAKKRYNGAESPAAKKKAKSAIQFWKKRGTALLKKMKRMFKGKKGKLKMDIADASKKRVKTIMKGVERGVKDLAKKSNRPMGISKKEHIDLATKHFRKKFKMSQVQLIAAVRELEYELDG